VTEPILNALTVVLVVLVFVVVLTLGLSGAVIVQDMVDEVNRRLPPEQRYGSLWWGPIKKLNLVRDYKHLCPDGPLLRYMRVYLAVFFLVFAVGVYFLSASIWPALFFALGGFANLAILSWWANRG